MSEGLHRGAYLAVFVPLFFFFLKEGCHLDEFYLASLKTSWKFCRIKPKILCTLTGSCLHGYLNYFYRYPVLMVSMVDWCQVIHFFSKI